MQRRKRISWICGNSYWRWPKMSNFMWEIAESRESTMGCVASLGNLNVKVNILREKMRRAWGQPDYWAASLSRQTLASGYLMLMHEPLMEKQVWGNHWNSGDSQSKCSYEQTFGLVLHELSPQYAYRHQLLTSGWDHGNTRGHAYLNGHMWHFKAG